MNNVTTLVLSKVEDFSQLNLSDAELNNKHVDLLRQSLTSCKLIEQADLCGGRLRMFKPQIEGGVVDAAVKVLLPNDEEDVRQIIGKYRNNDLDACWKESTNLQIQGRDRSEIFDDLTSQEKLLVVLAYEHRLHEELYPGFIEPAMFLTFTPAEEVCSIYSIPDGEVADTFKEEGRLSNDNREILIKKGETVYAMVQNFENLSKHVFQIDPKTMSNKQLDELEEFATRLEEVYSKTGYQPDKNIDNPIGSNLKFRGDKLILIDSNSIEHDEKHDNELQVVKTIRDMVNEGRNKVN